MILWGSWGHLLSIDRWCSEYGRVAKARVAVQLPRSYHQSNPRIRHRDTLPHERPQLFARVEHQTVHEKLCTLVLRSFC